MSARVRSSFCLYALPVLFSLVASPMQAAHNAAARLDQRETSDMASAPVFMQEPEDFMCQEGQMATFQAKATGDPAPTYQWLADGQPIAGATSDTCTFKVKDEDFDSKYSVKATNVQGSVTSGQVSLGREDPDGCTITFDGTEGGALVGVKKQKIVPGTNCLPVTARAHYGNMFSFWLINKTQTVATKELLLRGIFSATSATAHFVPYSETATGKLAPNVFGVDQNGEATALSNHYGKVIFMNIASLRQDPACKDAAGFDAFFKAHKDKGLQSLLVIGEDGDGKKATKEQLQALVTKQALTLPVQNDEGGPADGSSQVCYVKATTGFPTYVVIGKDFKVQYLGKDKVQAEAAAKKAIGV